MSQGGTEVQRKIRQMHNCFQAAIQYNPPSFSVDESKRFLKEFLV